MFQQWATFARIWHVYDAAWQNPFDSAKLLTKYLMGSNKPIYHPMSMFLNLQFMYLFHIAIFYLNIFR